MTTSTATQQNQVMPKLYGLDDIEKATSQADFAATLIDKIQDGFVRLEKGDEFFACPIQTLGLPPYEFIDNVDGYTAQTCVKSGYFKGQKYYVIKVASGGYPIPNSGLMQVYSQTTGQLVALLLDNGILTEIRTAAVGALAARLLAPKNIEKIGIVGTGIQARYQLDMLSNVLKCDQSATASPAPKVLIWGRSNDKSKILQEEMTKKGCWDEVTVAASTEQLLLECDLIVTTTCSREAVIGTNIDNLLQRRGGKKGLHITCIGADAPGKFELDPKLVSQADLLVADTVQQSVERGEFQQVVKDGSVDQSSIVSLGKLINDTESHRKNDDDDNRITIFDSSGVALQDCIVAEMTYNFLAEM